MRRLQTWALRSALQWTTIMVALIVGLAVVLEGHIRTLGTQATGAAVVEMPGGHPLLMVIIDSLAPKDAEQMESFQRLSADGWTATIEPCLERMTKMCIEEAASGRTAFSLFGLLRNLGPVDGGVGPNLLRDARQAGRTVAMLSRGDLSLLDADADEHVIYKQWRSKREIDKVLALTETHDIVVYHYAWHDLSSHRYRMGTPRYTRSVQQMDRALGRIVDGLPPTVDLMVFGDHGHTTDGRHLQGLDTPTVLAIRSDRVESVAVSERVHITVARFLAGLATGLHSPDSAWKAEWADWAVPSVAELLPQPTLDASDGHAGRPWLVIIPLALLVLFVGRIGGVGAGVAVAVVGMAMGLGWEVFMDRVHYAHGIPRFFKITFWIPLAGAAIGLIAGRRLKAGWAGVVIASGVTCLVLYPLIYHYGVFRNALAFGAALTVAPAAIWLVRRRALLAIPVGVVGIQIWRELTWIKVTNLEVREYRSVTWMEDAPLESIALLAALAILCQFALERGRWMHRLGWGVLAAVGMLAPLPDSVRMALFCAVLFLGFLPHTYRARGLGLAVLWSLPMLFSQPRLAGVLGTVMAAWMLFLAVRGAMDDDEPGRLWGWTAGLGLALAAHVSLGWTFGLNVSGVDFGFTLGFLPGDLHERLWWLIAIFTILKLFVPVLLMTGIAHSIFGTRGRALVEACGLATMLRAAVVTVAAIAWMFAPGSNAGGTSLASVLQDGFYWACIGWVVAIAWWVLERGRPE